MKTVLKINNFIVKAEQVIIAAGILIVSLVLIGNVEYWVAVVKPGKVIFEIAGVPEELAQSAFRLAGFKLPIKTKFIKREAI